MAVLELENLSKRFPGGTVALEDISLRAEDGELVVLLGPSGAGKTTLLRLVAGLERPTAGRVRIGGRPVERMPPVRRDVAMVFQHGVLYPHLSVRRNLAFGLRLRGLGRTEVFRRVTETARLLGIAELLDRRPHELSAGQQQRVALGRAIVRRPQVFLFDEPFSHLDNPLRLRLCEEIRRLHEQLQITTLWVTHDPFEALRLGRRMGILHAGRLQQIGSPDELCRRPANRFVAEMLAWQGLNLIDGRIEQRADRWMFVASTLSPRPEASVPRQDESSVLARCMTDPTALRVVLPDCWRAKLAAAGTGPVSLAFQPEDAQLAAAESTSRPGDDSTATVRIGAEVVSAECLGRQWRIRLRAGTCGLTVYTSATPCCRPEDRTQICVPAERVHLFQGASGRNLLV